MSGDWLDCCSTVVLSKLYHAAVLCCLVSNVLIGVLPVTLLHGISGVSWLVTAFWMV